MSWESSYDNWKTTPPDEPAELMTDMFGNPIYDGDIYYDIDGIILSEEGLEECKFDLTEDETFECYICEDECGGDDGSDSYYLIEGNKYCSDCIDNCKEVALA